jgi:sigma-B regulation protein RsbU (phosphoserine phosphatase)
MHVSTAISFIVWTVVVVALVIALKNQRRRAKSIHRRFNALKDEEERIFSFLHDLGVAIEHDPSPAVLSRIIVDGIDKVVTARGGAIYFLSPQNDFLNPSYISQDCPPFVTVPLEIRERAEQDPRALESHLRLSRVPVSAGILGHCLAAGEPILVHDLRSHPAMLNPQHPYEEQVSALLSPLRHANKGGAVEIHR